MITPQELIEEYKLAPHPEGGYYRECYKAETVIPKSALPKGVSNISGFIL